VEHAEALQGIASRGGVPYGEPVFFLHCDRHLQGVEGVQAYAFGPEKRGICLDGLRVDFDLQFSTSSCLR